MCNGICSTRRVVNKERTRDVHKCCLQTETVEGKIRVHNSGISIQKISRMCTGCGEYAPTHYHRDKECANSLHNICHKAQI